MELKCTLSLVSEAKEGTESNICLAQVPGEVLSLLVSLAYERLSFKHLNTSLYNSWLT